MWQKDLQQSPLYFNPAETRKQGRLWNYHPCISYVAIHLIYELLGMGRNGRNVRYVPQSIGESESCKEVIEHLLQIPMGSLDSSKQHQMGLDWLLNTLGKGCLIIQASLLGSRKKEKYVWRLIYFICVYAELCRNSLMSIWKLICLVILHYLWAYSSLNLAQQIWICEGTKLRRKVWIQRSLRKWKNLSR